jgi:AGZA family xanthine/uracil permease-like MFS transporter
VTTAALFLGALFFAPLVATVGGGVSSGGASYYPITAPVVILVGSLMMGQAGRIAWQDATEAIPAFVTLALIPFTFNIAHGVAGGIVAYVLVKAGTGRGREVSWLVWALAGVLVAAYALLPRLRH